MNPKIDTVAALKRLPIGTKLKIIRSLMGPNPPSGRIVSRVQSNALVLKVDDPASKNNGNESYLWLPSGTKVRPTEGGFQVLEPEKGEVGAEYVFAE